MSKAPGKGSGKGKKVTKKHVHYSKASQRAFKRYIKSHPLTRRQRAKRHANKPGRTLTLNGFHGRDQSVEFGRNAMHPEATHPRLKIDKYMTTLPAPPLVVDRASKVASWPMYGNDTVGDCTCATVGHQLQAWTAYASAEATIPESAVMKAYEAISGYVPGDPQTDVGANIQDVLDYWRRTGVGGHKISMFAQISQLDNFELLKSALDLFGSVYLGLNVPDSAMDQFNEGEPWTLVPGSQIDGGHAVPVQYFGTGTTGDIHVITWGSVQPMTRAFFREYVEEAWVIITPEWLQANGETIEGFDLATLKIDFNSLTGEPVQN